MGSLLAGLETSLTIDVQEAMKLNIIIVNFNSGPYLHNCVTSLHAMNGALRDHDITVYDNGSHDHSFIQTAAGFPLLRYIRGTENRGFACAVNRVISMTRGEYILLLNPDVVVFPHAIETMIAFMDEHPLCGVVGAEILSPSGYRQPTCRTFPRSTNVLFGRRSLARRVFPNNPWTRTYLYSSLDYTKPQCVDFVEGSVMMLRRTALEDIGCFDEDFFLYLEDADVCYRMKKHGWETWWIPRAYAIHYRGETFRTDNIHPAMHHSRGFALFFRKHYGLSGPVAFALKVLLALRLAYVISTESIKKLIHDSNFSPRK
ncbi:glycosyltransferase family 2 protein [candidate division WOR-3 bacterium]|nr:glycosyltransferase family 2 protein [candidate division WOR-3 bacterium]